jgi:hypothetical protein
MLMSKRKLRNFLLARVFCCRKLPDESQGRYNCKRYLHPQ